jgi:hypothetical protein
MKKKKAYFSHSKMKYNTLEETEELNFIKKHFGGEVICPNNNLASIGGIENNFKTINSCDCLYATEYKGLIGRGVYDECRYALNAGKTVYVVRKDLKGNYFVQSVKNTSETLTSNFVQFGCLIA